MQKVTCTVDCVGGARLSNQRTTRLFNEKRDLSNIVFHLHLVLNNFVIPVISNKLDGGMLNKITKSVAEKFIQQGKTL